MDNLIILGLIKILDNIILNAKSIATFKNKRLISSILVILSQFSFYFIISKVVNDKSVLPIIIVAITSGIGNYIAFIISDRFEQDKMWTNVITGKDIDKIKGFCELLKQNKIKYITNDSYDRHWNKTYSVMVFPMTKNESTIIDKYLENVACLRKILK